MVHRALYKGFIPKALRLGLGQTIGLMTFNKVGQLVLPQFSLYEPYMITGILLAKQYGNS